MKNVQIRLAILLLSTLNLLVGAHAQLTPSGDAYTNTADPTTNYGAKTLLNVESASQTSYIQFNLASIPAGYTSADITKATLKLYVNTVTKAGSFNVDYVNGTWSESTITADLAPTLGSTIAASVPLTTTDKNQYILIDITAALQAWLSGTPNDGIALVGNSPLNAAFDSKESTTTSHAAELDIVFAPGSGGGGITGITTATGSGLIGGGTSGTLSLSLTNACASNQVLQWSGTAWTCATLKGSGTITGVTAGTDLTGGGTSGAVTLNVDTTKVPQLAAANTFTGNQTVNGNVGIGTTAPAFTLDVHGTGNFTGAVAFGSPITFASGQTFPGTGTVTGVTAGTGLTGGGTSGSVTLGLASNACAVGSAISALPFTCSPFATLAANTFTGNQTVNGNLSATGVVTGSGFQIGSNLFAFGSISSDNVFLGFAGNSTMSGVQNTATGLLAFSSNASGDGNTANGALALSNNTAGGNNTAVGFDALPANVTGNANAAIGYLSLSTNTTGGFNTAIGWAAGGTADASSLTGKGNTAVGAGAALATGTLTNGTAIGSGAEVSENNAVVLGSVKGVNNSSVSASVGIGTTAPAATLDVRDNGSGNSTISAITSALNNAVYGSNTATSGGGANGAMFITSSPQGSGIVAQNTGTGGTDYAAYLVGNVFISGNVSKGGGSFKIDHPLDPANKYLYHSFVESPDMMNIYNGVAALDAKGSVWITLPEYFEALNQDFRYQLTSIGRPQPSLYVAREISANRFRISGGKPGGKVSWQVTGIRHDAYADAHRIKVEEEKPPQEQGRYLHPELFGAPAEQAIGYPQPPQPTRSQSQTADVSSLK